MKQKVRTQQEFDRVMELRREGISYRKIATMTNIPLSTVHMWCKQNESKAKAPEADNSVVEGIEGVPQVGDQGGP